MNFINQLYPPTARVEKNHRCPIVMGTQEGRIVPTYRHAVQREALRRQSKA